MLNLSHHRVIRHRARTVFVLFILLFGSLNSIATQSANAQPLCLDGKIWDADAEECVDMDEGEDQTDQDDQTAEPTEEDDQDGEDSDTEADVTDSEDSDNGEDANDALTADEGTATIVMYSHTCPAGFDPKTADSDTRITTCNGWVGGVEYTMTVGGNFLEAIVSPDGVGGTTFASVPIGQDFVISSSTVTGFSGPFVVACFPSSLNPGATYTYTLIENSGGFGIPGLKANEFWYCNTYFVPKSTGEITAYVFDCPAGTDIQTTEPDALTGICAPYLTNIQFELDLDGLVSSSSTNTLGSTTYTAVPPGQYRLKIVVPEGYAQPVVFCQVNGPSGQTLENYDRFEISNAGSIGLGMDEMEYAACDFFLAPSEDAAVSDAEVLPPGLEGNPSTIDTTLELAPGTVYINIFKLDCPDGVDTGPDAPAGQCAGNEQTGIGFVVTSNNDTFGSDLTDVFGFADFTGVPAGEITVQEALPLGYGQPIVTCRIVDTLTHELVSEEQLYVASPDGAVHFSGIPENRGIYCSFRNIPTSATGSIDAIAWSCPDGYDIYTKSPEELIGECGQKLDGVEFQLQHATAGFEYQVTSGQRSTAYFRDIAPGQLTLRESMPAGYGIPVVFCEVRGPDGQTVAQYDRYNVSNSASVQLGMNELDYFKCDFFQVMGGQPVQAATDNGPQEGFPVGSPIAIDGVEAIDEVDGILLPDDTPGEVTLVKHECPVGFDAYNATANDINLTCEYVRETIYEFSLNDSAGGFQNLHTAIKDPLVEFEAVAPGAVSIMESVPPGFGEPVIYCQTLPSGGEATPYEQQPVVNANTLQITLPAAGWIACDWFNVPEGAPAPNPADDAVVDPNLGDLPLEVIDATGSEGGSASAALVEEGTIGLHIFNYECQNGVDVTGLDYLALIGVCGETIPGVDFNVAINGSQVAPLTTSGAPAYLFSSDIPAGDMTITEVVPRGFGTPIVY